MDSAVIIIVGIASIIGNSIDMTIEAIVMNAMPTRLHIKATRIRESFSI